MEKLATIRIFTGKGKHRPTIKDVEELVIYANAKWNGMGRKTYLFEMKPAKKPKPKKRTAPVENNYEDDYGDENSGYGGWPYPW